MGSRSEKNDSLKIFGTRPLFFSNPLVTPAILLSARLRNFMKPHLILSYLSLTHLMALPAYCTTLTFSDLSQPSASVISTSLGSNANTSGNGYIEGDGWTPNVTVAMSSVSSTGIVSTAHLLYFNSGYGNLTDIAYASQNGLYSRVTLEAERGFEVTIKTFELGSFGLGMRAATRIRILDGMGSILWDADGSSVSGGTAHSTYTPSITGDRLTIEWGNDWNIGMDNLNFVQSTAIPEPSASMLISAFVLFMASRRRR